MGFLIFTIPMIVVCLILMTLQQGLEFLLAYSAAINTAVAVLLAVNLLCMAGLIALWVRQRRAGQLAPAYIRQQDLWRRLRLQAVRWLALPAAVWEGLMVLLCALYLILQPLQYLAPFIQGA